MQQQIDFGPDGGGAECPRKDCPRKKARMGMESVTEIDLGGSGSKSVCPEPDCPRSNMMP